MYDQDREAERALNQEIFRLQDDLKNCRDDRRICTRPSQDDRRGSSGHNELNDIDILEKSFKKTKASGGGGGGGSNLKADRKDSQAVRRAGQADRKTSQVDRKASQADRKTSQVDRKADGKANQVDRLADTVVEYDAAIFDVTGVYYIQKS